MNNNLNNFIKCKTATAEQTTKIGQMLGNALEAGDIILLKGEMGTGKTTLTQGIGQALDVQSTVNSPTFIILAKHSKSKIPLYHADLFRLTEYEHSIELDLIEDSKDGILVIEWPEIAEEIFPKEKIEIQLSHTSNSNERTIEIQDNYNKYGTLLDKIYKEFQAQ